MLRDCFIIGAQTLNILLLVCLLERFFYKPILSATHSL